MVTYRTCNVGCACGGCVRATRRALGSASPRYVRRSAQSEASEFRRFAEARGEYAPAARLREVPPHRRWGRLPLHTTIRPRPMAWAHSCFEFMVCTLCPVRFTSSTSTLPLARVDYQGFLPLLTGRTDPDFVARYNAFFSLPTDDFDLECCERVRIHILDRATVERYRVRAAATGRPVLLEVIPPYGYTDGHPAAFHALRAVSPYRAHRPAGPIRVCIHLRRGDISVPGRTDGQERLLPDSYYLRVCNTVLDALRQHGVPFIVRLHTEVPTRRCTLYPDTPVCTSGCTTR